ncbi:hypothetical protein LX32DRAFT_351985 [Colletotrichum zoysiae]|uniref:Uncharacterized protein n=1 Tax=Colletotrichum zoysiae TaxID=1216348 RepID=A0AAD9HIN1_9PEZI|nr:hypothetical protein LX32DRAFT_351985 [Colletotrichum zoysiae]
MSSLASPATLSGAMSRPGGFATPPSLSHQLIQSTEYSTWVFIRMGTARRVRRPATLTSGPGARLHLSLSSPTPPPAVWNSKLVSQSSPRSRQHPPTPALS